MSSAAHTPEPWRAGEDAGIYGKKSKKLAEIFYCLDEEIPLRVCEEEAKANARRLVACVNACAGLSTAALEAGIIQQLVRELRGF